MSEGHETGQTRRIEDIEKDSREFDERLRDVEKWLTGRDEWGRNVDRRLGHCDAEDARQWEAITGLKVGWAKLAGALIIISTAGPFIVKLLVK